MTGKQPPTTSHNYLAKIERLLKARRIRSADVNVLHEVWCDANANGFCNCDPTILPWSTGIHIQ